MFQNNGMPTGYDQIQPGLDQPNQTPPGQPGRPRTALQGAIMGGGASQYPTDPSMAAWRQGGQQRQLGQPHGMPGAGFGSAAGSAASGLGLGIPTGQFHQQGMLGAGGALGSMGAQQPQQVPQQSRPMPQNIPAQQPQNPGGAVGFIHQWQNEHPGGAAQGTQPLMHALQAAGYNASPYMYGQTQSGNEISLNGEKFKLLGGENGSNPFWYQGGYDGGGAPGGGALRPQIHQTVGLQQSNPALLQAVMYGQQGQQPTNYLQQMLGMGSPTSHV